MDEVDRVKVIITNQRVVQAWRDERENFDVEMRKLVERFNPKRKNKGGTNQEFLDHLLDVHRLWCRSCRPTDTAISNRHGETRKERKSRSPRTKMSGTSAQSPPSALELLLHKGSARSKQARTRGTKRQIARNTTKDTPKKSEKQPERVVGIAKTPNIKVIRINKSKPSVTGQFDSRIQLLQNLAGSLDYAAQSGHTHSSGPTLLTAAQTTENDSQTSTSSSSSHLHGDLVSLTGRGYRSNKASALKFPHNTPQVEFNQPNTRLPLASVVSMGVNQAHMLGGVTMPTTGGHQSTSSTASSVSLSHTITDRISTFMQMPQPFSHSSDESFPGMSSTSSNPDRDTDIPGTSASIHSGSGPYELDNEARVLKEEALQRYQSDSIGMTHLGLSQGQCVDEDDDEEEDDVYDDWNVHPGNEEDEFAGFCKSIKLRAVGSEEADARRQEDVLHSRPEKREEPSSISSERGEHPVVDEQTREIPIGQHSHLDQTPTSNVKKDQRARLLELQGEARGNVEETLAGGSTPSDLCTSQGQEAKEVEGSAKAKKVCKEKIRIVKIPSPESIREDVHQESASVIEEWERTVEETSSGGKETLGTSASGRCKCIFCDFVSSNTFVMNDHIQTHVPKEPGSYDMGIAIEILKRKNTSSEYLSNIGWCDECQRLFLNITGHRRMVHKGLESLCPECGKMIKDQCFNVHRLSHLEVDEKDYVKCPDCPAKFKHVMYLKKHTQHMHKERVKKYVCSTCGKRFPAPTVLERHELIHSGVKPFKCPECDKSFTQKANLQVHMRQHTGHKPYVCDFCGAAFTNNVSMKNHKKKLHGVDWWKLKEELEKGDTESASTSQDVS